MDTTSPVEQLASLRGHSDRVTDLGFSPDGAALTSSSRDGTIRLWDVENGQEVHAFSVNEADLSCIAYSPDEALVASAEAIWHVGTRQVVHTLERGLQAPGHVAFSPDGSLLAVALFNHPVRLWDVVGGQVVRDLDWEGDAVGYFGIGFSPDGARLAAGELGGTIPWWEIASGEIGGTFEYGDESCVHDIAFSPDGPLLASGGTDPGARLWDAAGGDGLQTLPVRDGLYSLAFSFDGTMLATAGVDRTVQL